MGACRPGLRAFLRIGLKISGEAFDAAWQRLAREPADPDRPELVDLFEGEFEGPYGRRFDWLLMNLVVRDGVTDPVPSWPPGPSRRVSGYLAQQLGRMSPAKFILDWQAKGST